MGRRADGSRMGSKSDKATLQRALPREGILDYNFIFTKLIADGEDGIPLWIHKTQRDEHTTTVCYTRCSSAILL